MVEIVAGKQGMNLAKNWVWNPEIRLCTAQRRGALHADTRRGALRARAAGRACTAPRGSSPVLAF